MCKELEERLSKKNIDLGFKNFCERTANANQARFFKLGYISLQFNYFLLTRNFLPDSVANEVVADCFKFKKQEHLMDLLNRTDDFVFKD